MDSCNKPADWWSHKSSGCFAICHYDVSTLYVIFQTHLYHYISRIATTESFRIVTTGVGGISKSFTGAIEFKYGMPRNKGSQRIVFKLSRGKSEYFSPWKVEFFLSRQQSRRVTCTALDSHVTRSAMEACRRSTHTAGAAGIVTSLAEN